MTAARDRRLFLKYLGLGLTGAAAADGGPLGPVVAARGPMPFQHPVSGPLETGPGSLLSFTPIEPSSTDDLVLPPGFTYHVIAAWGDRLPGTNSRFGYNADFTAFIPIAANGGEGVLWVNHEYISFPATGEVGVYTQTFPQVIGGVPQTLDYMQDVGGSVLHIKQDPQYRWVIQASRLTRRIDATTPMVASGPALQRVSDVGGTHSNCSGAHTPWNTVLTCEENFQDYAPEAVDTSGRGSVGGRFNQNGAHFGWVVEIDPLDPAFTPVKHTMLGRYRHENVALRTASGEHVIAYLGDDRTDGHVYKFVSSARYVPGSTANRGTLLSSGRLYAAVFNANGTGEWRELAGSTPLRPVTGASIPTVPSGATTLGQVYSDLGAIVTDAFRASNLIGATPSGRPEDIEVHPLDNSVYIAFTAGATLGASLFSNLYGELWRLVEEGDGTGTRFTWMRWKAGGPNDPAQAGRVFAAPDNLSFDAAGNLWVVTDISSVRLNGGDVRYTAYKNNGMFVVPTSGPTAGMASQFASGPCEAELTGPAWTPDQHTLFLAVQHPGEVNGIRTGAMAEPRGSNWPSGRVNDPPRPGVVAIRRRS
jgi:secreted PhoX family phosphatase